MTIDIFIDACNKFLPEGFLVLKKSITPNAKFKVYKNFKYEVWLVKGVIKEIITETELNARAASDTDYNNATSTCEGIICEKLIKYIKEL